MMIISKLFFFLITYLVNYNFKKNSNSIIHKFLTKEINKNCVYFNINININLTCAILIKMKVIVQQNNKV